MSSPTVVDREAPEAAPQAPRSIGTMTGVILVIGASVLVAAVSGRLISMGFETLAVAVAGLCAVVVGVLALTHFDRFIMVLLVVRASLDILGLGGLRGGALDPAAAVGAVFVATSAFWLLMRYFSGEWVKPAAPTKALYALAGASIASVYNSPFKAASIEACARLLAGVLMFAVLEQLLARRRSAAPFLWALLASAALPLLVGYYQLITGSGVNARADAARVLGTFAHPNPYASFLVSVMLTASVVALRGDGPLRRAAIAVVVAAAPMLAFTYTRAAWIAFIVGAIYLGAKLDRRIILGIVAAALLTVAISPSILARITDVTSPTEIYNGAPSNSLDWRIRYWGELLPLNSDSPLTGIGIEVTQRVSPRELQPHNTFVQTYVELGLIGSAAMIAVVVTFARHLRRRLRLARTLAERLISIAAIAVGLAWIAEAPSANLLTTTVGYWYVALAMLYGYGSQSEGAVDGPVAAPRRWVLRPKEAVRAG